MKLFRLRFILLGLLLCLHRVWCLTCGTEFDDTASSAYKADIVIIGELTQALPPSVDNNYNATVTINKLRNVFKGESLLKSRRLLNRRGSSLLTIGEFGKRSPEYCIADVERGAEYIFFLNKTSDMKYFKLSAMPVSTKNKKSIRRAKKDIKKILCNKSTCVKIPEFDPRKKMRDQTIEAGKKLELNCRLKRKPLPNAVFTWLKDGKDINTLSKKRFRIRTTKKGSRLSVRKASPGDSGNYVCIARNVGGDVQQAAVIKVQDGSTTMPEPGSRGMQDKEQKFGETLRLTCKVKSNSNQPAKFTWKKGEKEIKTGDMEGLTIRYKDDESKLKITKTLLSDEGVYTCIVRTSSGTTIQKSNVTVIDGPKKEVPCGPEHKNYCLNGGNCSKYVSLNETFCTCQPGYHGTRCMELSFDKAREDKLAQDRTFIVVGIISGILLFIGICVASYFLAKRRRDQFHRRRRQRANGNIEDNIPQVYRPLIGCDDIDGLTKKMNGVLIHKETQTTETCFLTSDKTNLYINPLESYTRNDGGDRNNSRSRKSAVSLEEDPRRRKSPNTDQNERNESRKSNPSDKSDKNDLGSKSGSIGKHLNVEGIPDRMNDLSPRHTPIQKSSDRPVGANHNPNIPSPKSARPPALNLDTDSDDEPPKDGTPLTPLHISEEEDNSELFKKCKPKRTEEENAELFKKCKVKATALQAFGPPKRKQENQPFGINRKQDNQPFGSNKKQDNHPIVPNKKQDNQPIVPNRKQDSQPYGPNKLQEKQENQSLGPNRKQDIQESQPFGPNKKPENQLFGYNRKQENHPFGHIRKQENIPKSNSKEKDMTLPIHSPENNTAVSTNGEVQTPGKRSKSSSSANEESDSSTTTEGCDSPGTAWANSQEFSDVSPTPPPPKTWNERGSPEPPSRISPAYYNITQDKVRQAPFANKGHRYTSSDPRDDDRRNNKVRTNMKDKFSIAI
ncbi:pro-neuregulin-1, membrane-bound isoform-like isoform X2 [Ruditapes philippinarum]|uniref:pro-neuregulin-1, membrane-bound isoform-like isoform X2 n=1 Tax=Ruditapes philippinarum TaxID=129788 RepID=UPI00295C2593|nr:pro-neuregulin-1, membrane-bound isoform-like isoform X2 [Ruditapes philippinarum]